MRTPLRRGGSATPRGVAPTTATVSPETPPLITRLRRDLLRGFAASPLYRHTLIGRVPADLRLRVGERWPGDARRGAAILSGEITLAGQLVRNPMPVWFPPEAGVNWLAAWHDFSWVADLLSVGGGAKDAARALVQSWLTDNTGWHPIAWRADVLATRIYSWIVHFDEIASREADRLLRRAMLASLVAQLRHLARTAAWELSGPARLRALKGLIAGLVAFGNSEKRVIRALRAIESEVPTQILPDGGHRSRSPSVQLDVLRDLVDTRAALRAGHIEVPAALQDAIDRMAPMLRFFRHGDRKLALFNNSIEEDGILVDLVLTRSETKGRAPANAPHTGFQRLQAGHSLVLIDTGKPPSQEFDEAAHAGPLSFEMSQGRERVIVNCGGYRGAQRAWRQVARSTAAHSVLVVADINAVEINDDGTLGRSPPAIRCERAESDGHQWVAVSHDGYRQRFGLIYARELYLAADGDDLRGEDKLTGQSGMSFVVRFHLHPSVEPRLVQDASAVLLRLPSGLVWRLRASGAEMSLAESIYLGSGELKPTQQVVLTGTTGPNGALIRWALRREGRALGEL
jgi:uncharacterized heparinase superfamily protein